MAETARCTWCTRRTTKKQLQKMQMCGPCTKMAERHSFTETLANIPEEVEDVLAVVIGEQPTLSLAASQMKKKYPLKHPDREWDAALVVLVDRRRRNRNGSY